MSVLRTQRINLGKIRSRTSRDPVFNQQAYAHVYARFQHCYIYHFSVEGWSGLMDEMEMEVKRISKRNLGRDDR